MATPEDIRRRLDMWGGVTRVVVPSRVSVSPEATVGDRIEAEFTGLRQAYSSHRRDEVATALGTTSVPDDIRHRMHIDE